MRVKFTFLIFQDGRFGEELEAEQEFEDAMQLAKAIAKFMGLHSSVRFDLHVACLYKDIPDIILPPLPQCHRLRTTVVIKDITFL